MSLKKEFPIKVLTLNCWGLWLGAKRREQRIAGIVRYLRENNCDIVFLQEVWVTADFEVIKNGTKDLYRFAHLFRSGSVLGSSGIVILTKWLPRVIHFEPYSLNGSPFYPWHGDWFAGKGIAYVRVDMDKISLHLFSTHTHAYYKENEQINDQYFIHRVCQSYQLARFITFIRDTSCKNRKDLLVVAGDINSTSSQLPYRILTTMAGLTDCFKVRYNKFEDNLLLNKIKVLFDSDTDDDDVTYCHPRNSFTQKKAHMKRIDFILCSGHHVVDKVASDSKNPLFTQCSLSDHEPVMVELKICDDGPEKTQLDLAIRHQVMEETQGLLMQYYNANRTSKIQLLYVVIFIIIFTLPTTTYYAQANEWLPLSLIVLIWVAVSSFFAIGLLVGFLSYRYEQGAIEAILNDITCKMSVARDQNSHRKT